MLLGREGVRLCRLEDIPDHKARGFDLSGEGCGTIFVVRKGQQLSAYIDICPHYGDTSLPWRKDEYLDAKGEMIVCAAHGARFNIDTGECISGPCLGQFLTPVQVNVADDGYVIALVGRE